MDSGIYIVGWSDLGTTSLHLLPPKNAFANSLLKVYACGFILLSEAM